MTVKIGAGWVGGKNFGTWLDGVRANQAIAVQAGVSAAAEGLRDELRDDVVGAQLGSKLSNAIGANVYPRNGRGSLDAAGYIFPRGRKAAAIFDSFNAASVITSHKGKYLAIPTQNAGRGYRYTKSTPSEFEARTGIKLQFAKIKGGKAVLVGDAITAKSGHGVRRATKGRLAQGRNSTRLVFFILIPVARMPHRLNFAAKAQAWADRIPELIDAAGKEVGSD